MLPPDVFWLSGSSAGIWCQKEEKKKIQTMVPVFVLLVKCVTVRVFLPELFSHGKFSITTINQTIIARISVVQGVGLGQLHAVQFGLGAKMVALRRAVGPVQRWPPSSWPVLRLN